MSGTTGKVSGVFGNLVAATFEGALLQNAVAYCLREDGARLMAEVIRIRGDIADVQVFEDTSGLKVGDTIEFTEDMLSVDLGPGLLGQIYDGLQNPLPRVAEATQDFFLKEGLYLDGLVMDLEWEFTPVLKVGDKVLAGDTLGTVPEGIFTHRIMTPFRLQGEWTVKSIVEKGTYETQGVIAVVESEDGQTVDVTMCQKWPVRRPLAEYAERHLPVEPLATQQRIIDTFFPVAKGGTYCVPGPFGAGKTVLAQLVSRHAEVDVVIVAACGERAGEVVETVREFPELIDPRTGRSLMERTIIICNTSAMPVAAREASVYTAVTLAEYYRQMGLNVLLLADSTSRWAQALREMSGRLEEIPGEEAFPAYLESRIASFYERAGIVTLRDGTQGSVTIGGTVSPAGGNFEEPVTQATLKVVGAFLGLSRARSDARRFPSIDPLDSWSRYTSVIDAETVGKARGVLERSSEISQMMSVVGEEGVTIDDFTTYLKGEFIDSVYLQQDGFDEVEASCSKERQQASIEMLMLIINTKFNATTTDATREIFFALTSAYRDWNYTKMDSDEFKAGAEKIKGLVEEAS